MMMKNPIYFINYANVDKIMQMFFSMFKKIITLFFLKELIF